MTTFDAWHLPGLGPGPHRFHTLEYDDVAVRAPVLEPEDVGRIAGAIRRNRADVLADRPVDRVLDALDAAAAALGPDGALREMAESFLPAIARYSPAMTRLVLDRMSTDWRRGPLAELLTRELGDAAILDRFIRRPEEPDRQVMARGPGLAFHVFAGNVPGVAVTSLVRSLLLKAATLAKTASDEPLLPVLFARALNQADPALAGCLGVTYWPGSDQGPTRTAAKLADAGVVYGGEEAVRSMHAAVSPATTFVVHGPRIAFGIVGRAALSRDQAARTAEEVARATAIFDQHGCVSPHAVYAERDGDVAPRDFAGLVASALARMDEELPRGKVTTREAAAIRQVRGAAEFRELDGADVRVHAGPGTSYTVVYDADPTFAPSCLNRTLRIMPVDTAADVAGHMMPVAHLLQSCAVAGLGDRTERLAEGLARLGVSRVTSFRRLPWPDPAWHHDGAGPLRELVRWVDLEG